MGGCASDPCGWGLLVLLPSSQRCSVPEAEVNNDKKSSRAVTVKVAKIGVGLETGTNRDQVGDSDNERDSHDGEDPLGSMRIRIARMTGPAMVRSRNDSRLEKTPERCSGPPTLQ